ncbi:MULTISPECIES: DUF1489 family protein [Marinovum]|uniref:DUF1489 family protein n=1 Tax=Marinovum TaxID=367771 RepID=UPI00065B3406|nr:DUF1489 domain-containing protein [Marinovum sp. PR37]AKO98520.1 hypothetical protein MALG_03376 [Marinovum algicola DG 898]MDD9742946.1 DUF1489 domain-containing protein [Marinovum sp. PR37]
MSDHINLIKLCVGTETPDDLARWQAQRRRDLPDKLPRHVTRMWPKRADELLAGGSLYWVFKGVCLARQRVIRLDEVIGQDGIPRCGIVLDPEITRTTPMPRRPFQGWRYLTAADAPADLSERARKEDPLPASLNAALAEIGVL